MPKVLITPEALLHVEGPHTKVLTDGGFEIVFPKHSQLSRGLLGEDVGVEELTDIDAVIAGGELYTDGMMTRLPKLRVIARNGVGYDRVDVGAATSHGIAVTITPTANHIAVAEHALALLFAVSKRIVIGDHAVRDGQWPRGLIEPIRGKTIGILGLGRIGRSMAIRSAALGMDVIAYDEKPDASFADEHGIELVDRESLLRRCDVLSIHCPVTESTRGSINRDAFAMMKPTAILINTARGAIVKEADLIEALRIGTIEAAGLDVFEQEPPAKDNPLFELDNVVLAPHSAGADRLAMRDMAIESATCIVKLYQGQWPTGAVVNQELQDQWSWST